MDRRGFLRGALGTLSATVGAFALRSGVDARESAPGGMQGQSVGATFSVVPFSGANWAADATWGYNPAAPSFLYEGVEDGLTAGDMTLVTGPDPDTMVHTIFHPDGTASVLPSWDALPADEMHYMMAIPRAEFPEFDPRHGIVSLTDVRPTSGTPNIGPVAIRIAYLSELHRMYPPTKADRERVRDWQTFLTNQTDEEFAAWLGAP